MISSMNQRYRRAYGRAKGEHYPDEDEEDGAPRGRAPREREIDPAEFMSGNPFNSGGKPSWEQFRGG